MKQHGKEQARGKQEQKNFSYQVIPIKSNRERVPKYRFHHVEISRNILTPNTMLKFVPHLRDLEKNEEERYSRWIQELETMEAQSGFKVNALNRPQKMAKTIREETAAEISLYLDRWIAKLGLDNCTKATLIRYMASHAERDDKMTPQQKSSIINSYSDDAGSPRAVRTAKMFTEAFDKVFAGIVSLENVLLLDESVETIVDSKKWVKDTKADNPGGEQLVEMVEQWLQSYTILGCLICYTHSCEHGEYDVDNQKRTFSIDSFGKFGGLLKKRRIEELKLKKQAGGTPKKNIGHPCQNQCYRLYDVGNDAAYIRPWTENETMLLRCLFASLGDGSVKAPCAGSVIMDRHCWDVWRKLKSLKLSLPEVDPAALEPPKIKPLTWYDRNKKVLLGDWQDHTVSHEHARRLDQDPCRHDGPCNSKCVCVQAGVLCERFCRCTAENCAWKFTGCACHSTGKTCVQRQKEGKPCICVQLNRECDPVLCKGCGARERADPQNAQDELLHSSGCQNVSLQRGVSKTVLLGKSQLEGCGYGLFTAEDIAGDEFVVEYLGELITHDEGVRREARRGDVFDEESNSSYLFTLLEQEGIWVDAAIYGNLSRYINHASEHDKRGCNITPKILYVNGEFRIKFTALRDIKAGEELFFNYGENFPNLTKKLLDSKEGGADGDTGSVPRKNKGGRPRKDDAARGGKATAARKKNNRGAARKDAPEPKVDFADSDFANLLDEDEEEEEDYMPGRHSQDDGDYSVYSETNRRGGRRTSRGGRGRPGRPRGSGRRSYGTKRGETARRSEVSLDGSDSFAAAAAAAAAAAQPVATTPNPDTPRRGRPRKQRSPELEETSEEVIPAARSRSGAGRKRKRALVVDSDDSDAFYSDDSGANRSGRKRQKPARYREEDK